MALAEFAAMETAYRALSKLDQAARARALAWLSGALSQEASLPTIEARAESTGQDALSPVIAPQGSANVADAPAASTRPESTPPVRRRRTPTKAATKQAAAASDQHSPTSQPIQKKGRGRKATADEAAANSSRAYRRMPATDDVVAAYRQVGSVNGIAEHFAVPRHTAQGWIRRLRQQGHLTTA